MARILVTDDSSFLRRRTCAILKQAGHEITEADNGITCLASIAEQVPDALFLDLVMPEMDGFEVLKALRDANYHFPVIVLTADIQDAVKNECQQLGAAAFINKPPNEAEIRQLLDQVLADQGAQP